VALIGNWCLQRVGTTKPWHFQGGMKRHVPFLLLALSCLTSCATGSTSPYRIYPQYEPGSRQVPPDIWWAGFGQRAHPQYA